MMWVTDFAKRTHAHREAPNWSVPFPQSLTRLKIRPFTTRINDHSVENLGSNSWFCRGMRKSKIDFWWLHIVSNSRISIYFLCDFERVESIRADFEKTPTHMTAMSSSHDQSLCCFEYKGLILKRLSTRSSAQPNANQLSVRRLSYTYTGLTWNASVGQARKGWSRTSHDGLAHEFNAVDMVHTTSIRNRVLLRFSCMLWIATHRHQHKPPHCVICTSITHPQDTRTPPREPLCHTPSHRTRSHYIPPLMHGNGFTGCASVTMLGSTSSAYPTVGTTWWVSSGCLRLFCKPYSREEVSHSSA